jgi:hypothetical protein
MEDSRGPAQRRLRSFGRDVEAALPQSHDQGRELAESCRVDEVKVGNVYLHGIVAVELNAGEGGRELFEIGVVGLAVDDEPGGVLTVGGLDSKAYVAFVSRRSHERSRLPRSASITVAGFVWFVRRE